MKSNLTIALLHGWATSPNIWESVAAKLQAKGFGVTIYEMCGYGSRKEDSAGHSFEWHVKDAAEKLHDCSIWVGWSLGAMLSLAAASEYVPNLKGVVAVNGTTNFCLNQAKTNALAELKRNVDANPSSAVKRFVRSMPSAKHRRNLIRELAAPEDVAAKDTLLHGLGLLSRADLSTQVNKICVPVRIISGLDDTIVPAQAGLDLQNLIPNSQFTALPCGHIPFMECPELFMEQLFEFAETIAQSQTG